LKIRKNIILLLARRRLRCPSLFFLDLPAGIPDSTNGLPAVGLDSTNGLPAVALDSNNGLPAVGLSLGQCFNYEK